MVRQSVCQAHALLGDGGISEFALAGFWHRNALGAIPGLALLGAQLSAT